MVRTRGVPRYFFYGGVEFLTYKYHWKKKKTIFLKSTVFTVIIFSSVQLTRGGGEVRGPES